MELKQFLYVLRKKDGITVQFSHLGFIVKRHGEILDQRGASRQTLTGAIVMELKQFLYLSLIHI